MKFRNTGNIVLKLCIIILFTFTIRLGWCMDEDWLFENYRSGNIDTIRAILNQIPDTTAAGLFFRGIFETDGEAARFYFDRILALYPGSTAEAWALERLWQYHWSRGDIDQAEKFYKFLKQRHPEHDGLVEKPDFKDGRDISSLLLDEDTDSPREVTIQSGHWRLQLGAFSKREGAKKIARKVVQFGPVDLVKKEVNGKELTVVMVGRLPCRKDALKLADEIKSATGLKGIPVVVDNN